MDGKAQIMARWITRVIAFVVLSVSGGALAQHWLERQPPVIQTQSCQGNTCHATPEPNAILLPERRADSGLDLPVSPKPESLIQLPRPTLAFVLVCAVLVGLVPGGVERVPNPRAPPATA
jgi:hypothetical protein